MSEAQGFIIPPPVPTPVSRCFENLFLLILIFIKFSVYLNFFFKIFFIIHAYMAVAGFLDLVGRLPGN